jgi:hypothetical protein
MGSEGLRRSSNIFSAKTAGILRAARITAIREISLFIFMGKTV